MKRVVLRLLLLAVVVTAMAMAANGLVIVMGPIGGRDTSTAAGPHS